MNSNPNGDPDREGEPRTRSNGIGEISPVSVKRKLRDLTEDKSGFVWQSMKDELSLADEEFEILESPFVDPNEIKELAKTDEGQKKLLQRFWDVRVFGTTYLQKDDEPAKEGESEKGKQKGNRFIHSGCIQFGLGTSISPVKVNRYTNTRKANPEEDKEGGMAPMGYRVVEHGVYTIPFFVNPNDARKMGLTEQDVELMLKLLPHIYKFTSSAARPNVEVRHVWYAKHNNPLGSVNDIELIRLMTPTKPKDSGKPSQSWSDYNESIGGQSDLPEPFCEKVALKDYANI